MGYLISNIIDNECNEKEDDDNGREDVSDAEGWKGRKERSREKSERENLWKYWNVLYH